MVSPKRLNKKIAAYHDTRLVQPMTDLMPNGSTQFLTLLQMQIALAYRGQFESICPMCG